MTKESVNAPKTHSLDIKSTLVYNKPHKLNSGPGTITLLDIRFQKGETYAAV